MFLKLLFWIMASHRYNNNTITLHYYLLGYPFFFGLFLYIIKEEQKREMEKHNVEKILLGILLLECIY